MRGKLVKLKARLLIKLSFLLLITFNSNTKINATNDQAEVFYNEQIYQDEPQVKKDSVYEEDQYIDELDNEGFIAEQEQPSGPISLLDLMRNKNF